MSNRKRHFSNTAALFSWCINLIGKVVALCIITTSVVIPVAPAFADEATASTEAVSESTPPSPEESEPLPDDAEETGDSLNQEADTAVQPVMDDVSVADGATLTESELEEPATTELPSTEPVPEVYVETPEIQLPDDTAESDGSSAPEPVSEDVASSSEVFEDTATQTPDVPVGIEEVATSSDLGTTTAGQTVPSPDTEPVTVPEVASEETDVAATEVPVASTTQPASITYNDSNLFSFGKNECVSMGNGTFYCSDSDEAAAEFIADGVFEEKDADGDKEIFIRTNGDVEQVTHNQVEDAAPVYDPLSRTIVWHRLVEGRYQIMSYDISDKTEEQLTFDRYNNMQPSRSGNSILWQGWVGNDWEIMLLEGDTLTMLTDNTTHDIAPHMNGDYIMWQAFEGDAWKVKVYDRISRKTDTIADSDGGSVQNPRVVLVYDTKFENGDVETKGYDFASGEVVPLSATPHPVPEDIPDPDQTGEKRAFVQQQVQLKTKVEESTEPNETGTPNPALPDVSGTSTSTVSDLVVPSFELSTTTDALDAATTTVEHIPDLEIAAPVVIDPASFIEDLVVPVYEETAEL